ncbi:MAG TPA: SpoIIE family protein phosphatase [Sedimentisphaerales bacterium]|nr:SpoIIE family protein phosphatase [Sedimentisphaerales bacterium]
MAAAMLKITGHGKTQRLEPNKESTIIGRSPRCDVVIESRDVSREHARIFQDPFGRWIVEDLGSSNGIFINGKRMEASAVLPGEQVVIGSFALSITPSLDQQIKRDDSIKITANITTGGFEAEIISGKDKQAGPLSGPFPEKFDEIVERLSELASPSALYPEVCRALAQGPKAVAAVLRLPEKAEPIPERPDILACYFGDAQDDTAAQDTGAFVPPRLAFRVSGHVLDAVRSTADAAMVKTVYSADTDVTWTAVDAHSPRALICAPLGDVSKVGDLLYLDIPIGQTPQTSPEQMFDFVRAVSRQVISTRKSLILMQAKAERSLFDHELSLAQKIQSKLAPAIPQNLSGVDLAVHYKPVMWVGGDYCDLWSLRDGRLAFAVGRVCDMGLPAAFVLSSLRILLRTTMSFCDELSEVMKHVNSHLIQDLPKETSVTLFLGVFDPAKGNLEYVNAGHPQPLIVQPQAAMGPLGEANDSMLGIRDMIFQTKRHNIQKDERLLVFTDGVTKAKSPKGDQFGLKGLTYILKTAGDHSAAKTIDSLTKAVADFRQMLPQQDDITLLCCNCIGPVD